MATTRRTQRVPLPAPWVAPILLILCFGDATRMAFAETGYAHWLETDIPGREWSLRGPLDSEGDIPLHEGTGSTTWTLEQGLYFLYAADSTLWRDGRIVAGNHSGLLQVGPFRSRVLEDDPNWKLLGEIGSVFSGPYGSLSMGIKGLGGEYCSYQCGYSAMSPGVTYWFHYAAWPVSPTATPYPTNTPYPTPTTDWMPPSSVADSEADPRSSKGAENSLGSGAKANRREGAPDAVAPAEPAADLVLPVPLFVPPLPSADDEMAAPDSDGRGSASVDARVSDGEVGTVETHGKAEVEGGIEVNVASNLTWILVQYHTPTGTQTWYARGGEWDGWRVDEYVEVPGPPLPPWPSPDMEGWVLF